MEELQGLLGEGKKVQWSEVEGGEPRDVFEGEPLPHLLQPRPDYDSSRGIPPLLDPDAVVGGRHLRPQTEEGPPLVTAPVENPYLLFGPRIIVRPDGSITKPFALPPGKGAQMLNLMLVMQPFPMRVVHDISEVPPPEATVADQVEIILLPNWDQELYQHLLVDPPPAPTRVDIADWLVVTAPQDLLWEVESFIDLFAAGVPQIEIEASIVEVTESDELDIGIRPLSIMGQQRPSLELTGGDSFVDSFNVNLPNKAETAESLLTLSTIQDGYTIQTLIEAVRNWENVSIDSRPKIAVREGGVASIVNTADIPFYGFSGITATGGFQASLQLREVGTKLYVVPRVVAGTISLDINLEVSQQIGTLVSFITEQGGELAAPIIARREARTVVYLEPGQAVVIGGLTSKRNVSEEQRVPILGDIPLLGLLFRSTFERTETTSAIFIIKPRILQAADLRSDF